MSRQLEVQREIQQAKRDSELLQVIEFGLVGSVSHSGGVLTGFSVKIDEWETLMTLRAVRDGVSCVAFVGAGTLPDCLRKASRAAQKDSLHWRVDRYASDDS